MAADLGGSFVTRARAGQAAVLHANGNCFKRCVQDLRAEAPLGFTDDVHGPHVTKPDAVPEGLGACPPPELKRRNQLAKAHLFSVGHRGCFRLQGECPTSLALCNNRIVQGLATPRHSVSQDEVVDSVLSASRALVAVAARSLAAAEEQVTLPQYRTLVVLASRGPQRALDLSAALDVNQSTVTRMCDRLERKGLISRVRPTDNRRTVITTLAPAGLQLVEAVTRRREREIRAILRKMTPDLRAALVPTFRAFADAAGEAPDQAWSLGWGE